MLVVIEGAMDSVGKSTQSKILKKYLEEKGLSVNLHHFPSDDKYYSYGIENYLKDNFKKLNNYQASLYFLYDFLNYQEMDLDYNKDIIIYDRYIYSTMIYQSIGLNDKDTFLNYLEDLAFNKLKLIKPDLIIFLTGDKNVFFNKLSTKENKDSIEKDLKYLDKVYDNARIISKKYNFKEVDVTRNGHMKSINEIASEIIGMVEDEYNRLCEKK